MSDYLKGNQTYWQRGYAAENVESFVFRPYGRIFKYEFGGGGAALRFFKPKGFDVYGVDISEVDIEHCRRIMPDVADHFAVIDPKPRNDDVFFGGRFDLVIAIQSLYYLSEPDLAVRLRSLHEQMKSGALIYATMIGTGHYMYAHSTEWKDGLRRVEYRSPRLTLDDYYVNFTRSEEDLARKFGLFERRHIGFYDAKYREDEGAGFHYTFVGQKGKTVSG